MTKTIHNAPTQEEIYAFQMQVQHGEYYDSYRIFLPVLSETQKEKLSHRFGIPLRILEDEQHLTLQAMVSV